MAASILKIAWLRTTKTPNKLGSDYGCFYSLKSDIRTVFWLFAFKGVEKIWPAGKGVGELGKCKFQHKQKLSPQREQSYLFQPRPFQLLPTE